MLRTSAWLNEPGSPLSGSSLNKSKFPNSQDELIVDVCTYTDSKRTLLAFDILVMREMPQLAIEVLSPQESSLDIFEKFQAYFALGIHSCWLVDPATETVHVYALGHDTQRFITGEVIDDVVGIKIPVVEIFE